jgi:hypothetical protein
MNLKSLLLTFICFFVNPVLADTQPTEASGVYKTVDISVAKNTSQILTKGTTEEKQKANIEIVASSEKYSPPVLYALANEFAANNQLDEALYWFYAAQLRASGDAKLSTDPTSASGVMLLNTSINTAIRKHQFDIADKLESIVDSVIQWDTKTPRKYDTRWVSLYGSKAMKNARWGEPAPIELSIPKTEWEGVLTKTRDEWHQGFIKALPMIKSSVSK